MMQPTLDANAQIGLARRHISDGNLVAAEEILARLKAVMAPHPLIQEHLGFIALQRGDRKQAARHYRKAVKLDKKCPELKAKLAEILLGLGDESEAVKLAKSSLRIDAKNISALNLLGVVEGRTGDPESALGGLKAAVAADPTRFESWHNLGSFRLTLGQSHEAIEALRKADSLRPNHTETIKKLGLAYNSVGDFEAAELSLNRARALTTDDQELIEIDLYLAEALVRAQRLDEALELIERIEQSQPGFPSAVALRATIYETQGRYTEALSLVQTVNADEVTLSALSFPRFVEAQCLLALGQHAEAAVAFERANKEQSQSYEKIGADKQVFLNHALESFSLYSKLKSQSLPDVPEPEAGKGMAFINGFPRSGTTLIDAILRMHSRVAVAEESQAALECWEAASNLVSGGRDAIGRIEQSTAEKLRATYLERLDKDLSEARSGKIAVDRHATGTLHAGLMKRLFPCAEFFLMVRHPCDAVLSAWFRNFKPTHHTASYQTIEDTAKTYAVFMKMHTMLEQGLGLNATVVRYEDLVTDLRGAVEPMLDRLGLEWEPEMEAFHQSTNRPKTTASFNQVSKPLYRDAVYRYENYLPTLAPVLPILEPWIERYDYPMPRG